MLDINAVKARHRWALTMTAPDMSGVSTWAFDFREPDGRRSPGLGVNGFRGSDAKVDRVRRAPEDVAALVQLLEEVRDALRWEEETDLSDSDLLRNARLTLEHRLGAAWLYEQETL